MEPATATLGATASATAAAAASATAAAAATAAMATSIPVGVTTSHAMGQASVTHTVTAAPGAAAPACAASAAAAQLTAAQGAGTRDMLLGLLDDIELISKEIIENSIAPKPQKMSATEHSQITELLLSKDVELKKALELAAEQAIIHDKMNRLKAEVDNQDHNICELQRKLKEAEHVLATALYQARQKLSSIAKSRKRPVPSEELIKFAHRISASNAICAPLSWQPGDPRRPYPTDIEMRQGLLGRMCDLPLNGHPPTMSDLHRLSGDVPASATNQFAWHPSGELHLAVGGASVPLEGSGGARNRGQDAPQEDVEVMSTDSSSSSSSDSQ